MKRMILDAIIKKLEDELERLHRANEQSNAAATQCALRSESQRDTTGLEASYLANGYAMQCNTLTRQIEELKGFGIDDFTGQEIDLGALVEVEMNDEIDCYFLLPCGGGLEVTVNHQMITVITPESPVGKALIGNVETGLYSFRAGNEGIILNVC